MKSFKQFSEAYTFVPKSEAELTDNQDLLSLYHAVMQMSGSMMPDPLAIDSKSMKKVKVHRMLDDYVNLSSLKKQFPSFKLDFGNGSRGGTGVGNAGIGFEGDFVSDVEKYIEAGLDGDFKYPDLMKQMHTEFLNGKTDIQVIPEGSKNQSRPIHFESLGALVGGRTINVGSTVTDVTIMADGKPYYMSLKLGGTVTFFNVGIKRIFTDEQFEAGRITHRDAKTILNMFGIDNERFVKTFTEYKRSSSRKAGQKDIVDVTSKVNRRSLVRMLMTGVGYGYYMVHKLKGKNVHFFKMGVSELKKAARVETVKVMYPKSGQAKRIDVQIMTPMYEFKVNIRNKQGGLYPSHIMCDYKYRHA